MTTVNSCPICGKPPKAVRVGDDEHNYWSVECYHDQGVDGECFIGCHAETEEAARKGWNLLTVPK